MPLIRTWAVLGVRTPAYVPICLLQGRFHMSWSQLHLKVFPAFPLVKWYLIRHFNPRPEPYRLFFTRSTNPFCYPPHRTVALQKSLRHAAQPYSCHTAVSISLVYWCHTPRLGYLVVDTKCLPWPTKKPGLVSFHPLLERISTGPTDDPMLLVQSIDSNVFFFQTGRALRDSHSKGTRPAQQPLQKGCLLVVTSVGCGMPSPVPHSNLIL